jgi:hypothetical protein
MDQLMLTKEGKKELSKIANAGRNGAEDNGYASE